MARRRDLSNPLAVSKFDDDKPKKKKRKTNRAIDREDKRRRKEKISKQVADKGFYSVDVSGERKVKKKVAKIQKKIDKVSDKKDARQKKLVESGVRRDTRKNQLLQKQVEAKRVESGKRGKFDRTKKTKLPKEPSVKRKTTAKKDSGTLPSGKYKPIRRGVQINRSKTGGGGRRKDNTAITKGKGLFGKNKRIK